MKSILEVECLSVLRRSSSMNFLGRVAALGICYSPDGQNPSGDGDTERLYRGQHAEENERIAASCGGQSAPTMKPYDSWRGSGRLEQCRSSGCRSCWGPYSRTGRILCRVASGMSVRPAGISLGCRTSQRMLTRLR